MLGMLLQELNIDDSGFSALTQAKPTWINSKKRKSGIN
jgi:hypothetical protein